MSIYLFGIFEDCWRRLDLLNFFRFWKLLNRTFPCHGAKLFPQLPYDVKRQSKLDVSEGADDDSKPRTWTARNFGPMPTSPVMIVWNNNMWHSKPFWDRGPKFPWGPKLGALMVHQGPIKFSNANFICLQYFPCQINITDQRLSRLMECIWSERSHLHAFVFTHRWTGQLKRWRRFEIVTKCVDKGTWPCFNP
jgi:hypothetical protein